MNRLLVALLLAGCTEGVPPYTGNVAAEPPPVAVDASQPREPVVDMAERPVAVVDLAEALPDLTVPLLPPGSPCPDVNFRGCAPPDAKDMPVGARNAGADCGRNVCCQAYWLLANGGTQTWMNCDGIRFVCVDGC